MTQTLTDCEGCGAAAVVAKPTVSLTAVRALDEHACAEDRIGMYSCYLCGETRVVRYSEGPDAPVLVITWSLGGLVIQRKRFYAPGATFEKVPGATPKHDMWFLNDNLVPAEMAELRLASARRINRSALVN